MPPTPADSSSAKNLAADLAALLGIVALFAAVLHLAHDWEKPSRAVSEIDLGWTSLFGYAINSLVRGWLAYGLSLGFTVVVALWAHRDARSRKFILPALDVLQSLPVLGFMPGLVFALVALFPNSNLGLELACILMIFTGQVWNMTFSLYDSLCMVPPEFRALGQLHRYTPAQVFFRIELPFAARGLIYNSMVSMAGGWFFLSINEAFRLGEHDFRLPGLGAYMSVAVEQGDVGAQLAGAAMMILIIVAVDRLIWWPLSVWANRFRMDDFGGNAAELPHWCNAIASSRAVSAFLDTGKKILGKTRPRTLGSAASAPPRLLPACSALIKGLVLVAVLVGLWFLLQLLLRVTQAAWGQLALSTLLTALRVAGALLLGTLWTIPAGLAIGLNPKWANRLQPWIQIIAAFPAPMVYPLLLGLMIALGGTLGWWSVLLVLLGTQWYILFNVISAAAAIPHELRSALSLMRLSFTRKVMLFYLPAIFPGLVTGWIAAAGGAWNATVVAEYVHLGHEIHVAKGLGSFLAQATEAGRYAEVAAAALVMACCVVLINLSLWRKLQVIAQERCRFLL